MVNEEPYPGLTSLEFLRKERVLYWAKWQVLHGRRQLVSWDVWLSPLTSATLMFSWISLNRPPWQQGGRRGWCQVSIALTPGATNTLQWPVQRAAKSQDGANPIKAGPSSDCRLKLACMKSESLVMVGQLYYREYVPGSCTHRPSNHESRQYLTC